MKSEELHKFTTKLKVNNGHISILKGHNGHIIVFLSVYKENQFSFLFTNFLQSGIYLFQKSS